MLERLFHLRENGTTVRGELTAGLTTFAAMAYILAVNPYILGKAGMDTGAVLTATALAAAFTTLAMGLASNYPLALAPGMGLNAFFAFTMCLQGGLTWPQALGLVFWEGVIFLALSVGGARRQIVDAIPPGLKTAIGCGIGLFIAFIGLKSGGVIVANEATFVGLGDFRQPAVWLVLLGIVLTATLVGRNVRGGIVLAVLVLAVVGLFVPALPVDLGRGPHVTNLPSAVFGWPKSLAPTFLKLDLGYLFTHAAQALSLLLTLLVVDLFDNLGTLLAVTRRAGFMDADGNLPRLGRALLADAGAAMFGALLGTSTTTSYIESAAGVEAGGRTGLTSAAVSGLFLLAMFFTPLILAIPGAATAPALVIVGIFMLQGVREIDWQDFPTAVSAGLTILAMPLTFSISEGIAVGFVVHALLKLGLGRGREVSWLGYGLAAIFALHFVLR